MLFSSGFKDAIVDAMISKSAADKAGVPIFLHESIYHYGSESSLARTLVVDMAVWG